MAVAHLFFNYLAPCIMPTVRCTQHRPSHPRLHPGHDEIGDLDGRGQRGEVLAIRGSEHIAADATLDAAAEIPVPAQNRIDALHNARYAPPRVSRYRNAAPPIRKRGTRAQRRRVESRRPGLGLGRLGKECTQFHIGAGWIRAWLEAPSSRWGTRSKHLNTPTRGKHERNVEEKRRLTTINALSHQ